MQKTCQKNQTVIPLCFSIRNLRRLKQWVHPRVSRWNEPAKVVMEEQCWALEAAEAAPQ
jgi:hypothetical protein